MSYIKRNFIFIVVFTLLFLFSFCIFLYSSQQKNIEELSNQFYTSNHTTFLDADLQKWIDIPFEKTEYRLFIEYNDTFRFFIQNAGNWSPPMEDGRFFLSGEDGNKAVVGKEMQDYIIKKNGLQYVEFQGKLYEVIGIVGDSFLSHVDYLILLSSQEVPQSPNAKIIIDSDKRRNVEKISEYMNAEYESIIEEDQSNRGVIKSASTGIFSAFFVVNSILLVIFSAIFYLRYWYEQEKNRINLYFLLGVQRQIMIKSILKQIIFNISIASIFSVMFIFMMQRQFVNEMYSQVIAVIGLFIILSVVLLISFLWADYFFHKKRKWDSLK